MLRSVLVLTTVFLVSLLVFLVLLMPAAVIVDRLPNSAPDGAPLPLSQARGLWWDGQAQGRWRERPLTLSWAFEWRAWVPGLNVSLRNGDLNARGWIGAAWGDWWLTDWQADVPLTLLNNALPKGSASGNLALSLATLKVSEHALVEARGTLHYEGGTASWGPLQSIHIPAMDGRLSMNETIPELSLQGPEGNPLLLGRLKDGTVLLQVFNALPQLLGMESPGEPSKVIFSRQQPLRTLAAGQ